MPEHENVVSGFKICRQEASPQFAHPDVPLISPDLQVDVDDVVIGHRQPGEGVLDGERPVLVSSPVMPDDPGHRPAVLNSKRSGGVA